MRTRAEWLAEGPFALVLSGGFFGFFSHAGLLAALEERGLRPARVVGVSAGAVAGAALACGLSAEAVAERLGRLRREEFWDPGLPLGGLLRGRRLEETLDSVLAPTGVRRIEEAPLPLQVVVHDLRARRARGLDRGPLARAVRASCAVPLLFRPVRWRRTLLVDGGVSDRSGLGCLDPGERALYHHLLPTRTLASSLARLPGAARPRCLVLAIPGQPACGPFRLETGAEALRRAHRAAAAWLDGALAPGEGRGERQGAGARASGPTCC